MGQPTNDRRRPEHSWEPNPTNRLWTPAEKPPAEETGGYTKGWTVGTACAALDTKGEDWAAKGTGRISGARDKVRRQRTSYTGPYGIRRKIRNT